jgi:hypothetical protein
MAEEPKPTAEFNTRIKQGNTYPLVDVITLTGFSNVKEVKYSINIAPKGVIIKENNLIISESAVGEFRVLVEDGISKAFASTTIFAYSDLLKKYQSNENIKAGLDKTRSNWTSILPGKEKRK